MGGAAGGARDGAGETPLGMAVARGHVAIARLLLASGADVERRNGSGATPLHVAAEHGQVATATVLLASGAVVDSPITRYDGVTALARAAGHGHALLYAPVMEQCALRGDAAGRDHLLRLMQEHRRELHPAQLRAVRVADRDGTSQRGEKHGLLLRV